MSQPKCDASSRTLELLSPSEDLPHRDNESHSSRNANGKRSRYYLQEDQAETPRKLARLNIDQHSEQDSCQQLSNPNAKDSNSNREQAFTSGPGHIVFIDEEGKSCPAICFNKGLLNLFNQVSQFTREVREGDQATRQAQLELEQIKSSNWSAGLQQAKQAVDEAFKSQEDIEAGIPGLKEAQQKYKALTQDHNWSKIKLDNSRAVSQIMIEQILKRENLLNDPPSKPQQPPKETKAPSWEQATPIDGIRFDISHRPTGSESDPASSPANPIDAEQQPTPRQLALRSLRFAAEELTYYKEELAYMQDEYPHLVAAERNHPHPHSHAHPGSAPSTTQTDLDLLTLQKTQRATRHLIEAEEAYDAAEANALALGLGDILADPQACFYGEVYNEFPTAAAEGEQRSEMKNGVGVGDRGRIERWMANVPDCGVVVVGGEEAGEEEEGADEWWDGREVEVWESVSLMARDGLRGKIDQWQENAEGLRRGTVVSCEQSVPAES